MRKERVKRQRAVDRSSEDETPSQSKGLESAVCQEDRVAKETSHTAKGWISHCSAASDTRSSRQSASSEIMQAAKKLVLVDEFDREYKRLQRLANKVAKADHSLQLRDTLRDRSVADDRKVRVRRRPAHVPEHAQGAGRTGSRTRSRHVRTTRTATRERTATQTTTSALDPLLKWTKLRSPGSFGGVRNLQRYGGRWVRESNKFLASRDVYTLHKPRRIRFPRRKTYSKGVFQIDQTCFRSISWTCRITTFNDGMRDLLTCIDVFTKRAWAMPVRRKSARDVVTAFEKIIADQKCTTVQSDKGTEFLNCLLYTSPSPRD